MNIFALIALELNHLAHLRVVDDGAIAGEFLLDHFEDLLLIELARKSLDGSQSLATIALFERPMSERSLGKGPTLGSTTHAGCGYGCNSAKTVLFRLQYLRPPQRGLLCEAQSAAALKYGSRGGDPEIIQK